MKKGLILAVLLIAGVVAAGFGYQILASGSHMANSEGFHDYLIPVKMSSMFFEKKITIFLSTKESLPGKIDDEVGWMVGFDVDSKRETGGKWPKIGADFILSIIHRNGKWNATIKNVKTQESRDFDSEIMIDKKKVDFSIPLDELKMKTEFKWQIAVVTGENKKSLPDLLKASKKDQKDNADYKDYMDKNMKM